MIKNNDAAPIESLVSCKNSRDSENNNGLINFLKTYPQLSETDIGLISSEFQLKRIKAGEVLSRPGEIADKLYFINAGIMKITVEKEELRNGVYYFMTPNQFMSFLYSLYNETPAVHGLEAATDCEVLVMDKVGLLKLYRLIPDFRSLLDTIAHLSMAEMITRKDTLLSLDASNSYKLLLKTQPEIALSVPLIDIATYLGITPQSLSRIRRQI
ncbi:Crp/Fnr family transcriptional regulator [Pedobacter sp. ISL-68]|uniref:Crp/Fnr family transcriptional regulator n=1 Tax=unclassified Pedobacter TaxID=2628915 RepID=UPI001BEA66E4|nr:MULTISPECIES: Crp/Fnr family transcriptional regulator [unclassified Pedobacter]MBT2560217.1 Crp/Fnr family transcriptional regulator [Pedobacter sp. ISL-64]MBT2589197.1 Crp/Fnr family transcriptional regulator [Pedobacter sp. ISL-68]